MSYSKQIQLKTKWTYALSRSSLPRPTLPNCIPSFSTEALKADGITTAWSVVLKRFVVRGTPRKPPTGVAGFADDTIGDTCCCCKLSWAGNAEGATSGAEVIVSVSTLLGGGAGGSSVLSNVGCDITGGDVIQPSSVIGKVVVGWV